MFNKSRMGTQRNLDTITAEMSLIVRCLSNQTWGTRLNNINKQHPLTVVGAHAYGACCCCVFLLFTHRQGHKRGRIRDTRTQAPPPRATDIPTTQAVISFTGINAVHNHAEDADLRQTTKIVIAGGGGRECVRAGRTW